MSVISLDDLAVSKLYVAKNNLFKFNHPMDYFRPFMEVLEGINGVEFQVQVENEVTNAEMNELKNTSYGRVAVTAKLPSEFDVMADVFGFNHLTKQIGMVYAFDTAKPEMKVYRGNRVTVCTNQCVFGADNVTSMLLASDGSLGTMYDATKKYADTALKETAKYKAVIEDLASQELDRSALMEHIGEICWFARRETKFGITPANDLVKSLQDEKSKYYIGDRLKTNKWLTYNGLTEALKKSSIMDEVSKTLMLSEVFITDSNKHLLNDN